MPKRSPALSSAVPDDLPIGPSVLAPGAPGRGDRIARLIIWPLLITLLLITVVFYVLFTPLRVVGDSMEPSLSNADRALRTKSYADPRRGDVVVLAAEEAGLGEADFVKRVVAVPGDTVEVIDDVAYVNGEAEPVGGRLFDEGYGVTRPEMLVPDDTVYVLGDNRPVSLDSRIIGVVALDSVRGRVTFRFLPLSSFGSVR